ncbi:hypothetical protein [Absidia glauca]|uniref:Globin domain-containing protein n=1 Tax=Absidia glauca TaxID=4829 RepID=A0A163K252_ABSGL|nr:hypothetical protein [Absidia glauca]
MGTKATEHEKPTSPYHLSERKYDLDPALMPTQQDIDTVRCSWERVVDLQHITDSKTTSPVQAFGSAFYDALFDLNPQVRSLFGDNVLVQARVLTGIISFLVRAPMIATNKQATSTPKRPTSKLYTIKEINARKREQQKQQRSGKDTSTSETNKPDDNGDVDDGEMDHEWWARKLRELGARHQSYKVKPEHFQLVGPAIDAALRVRLQEEYSSEIGKAWIKAHAFVAHHMALGLLSHKQQDTVKRSSSLIQPSSSSSTPLSSNCILQ